MVERPTSGRAARAPRTLTVSRGKVRSVHAAKSMASRRRPDRQRLAAPDEVILRPVPAEGPLPAPSIDRSCPVGDDRLTVALYLEGHE